MKTLIALFLVLLMGNTEIKKPKNLDVLLVLRSTMNKEYFSKFNIKADGNSLMGENVDYDYPVPSGIYRIESSSNDYYCSRRIIVHQDIY